MFYRSGWLRCDVFISVSIPISRIVKVFLCLIFVWCYVYLREVLGFWKVCADERLFVFWLLTYGVYWLVFLFLEFWYFRFWAGDWRYIGILLVCAGDRVVFKYVWKVIGVLSCVYFLLEMCCWCLCFWVNSYRYIRSLFCSTHLIHSIRVDGYIYLFIFLSNIILVFPSIS
jgi:hypothetical protein